MADISNRLCGKEQTVRVYSTADPIPTYALLLKQLKALKKYYRDEGHEYIGNRVYLVPAEGGEFMYKLKMLIKWNV